jgi:HD superfamily phosphohydrolase
MNHLDCIYGHEEIKEPVLLDLMGTEAMKRLKSVLQHGVTALIGITRPVSRYEHSMGVLTLVRRMGGSLEEQIASLLHDVSHTAFSHVIDYVFDGHETQSYHEEKKEEFVSGTDIPITLAKYGYDWHSFMHEDKFTLLEQPSPMLCADRLDYFLRDSLDLGLASKVEVQYALDHLVVHEERIVSDDLKAARWMGYTFIAADKASWANFREVGLYELTARAIRRGLEIGVLDEADIWGGDESAWIKLQNSQDAEIKGNVDLVNPQTEFIWDPDIPTFRVSTKLRTIDPVVLQDGEVRPLSTLDTKFAHFRRDYLENNSGLWPMRVVGVNT